MTLRWRALVTACVAISLDGFAPAGVFAADQSLDSVVAEPVLGDAVAGRAKAGRCRTCHGLDGVARIPIAPHIGGEPVGYLARQLEAFRSGERQHEMMSVVASGLSDADIANVAAWYAGHTPVATPPAGRDAADAPIACLDCHGVNGLSRLEDAPNLAGESVIYIATQLKAFRLGKRRHEIMTAIAADLTDDQIRAVADWYAGIEFTTAMPE